jgi:hypothetical protein
VLIAWSMYLANVWFGFDLRPREGRDPHEKESLYFWLATIATPIALLVGWWRARTALHLARCGVEVEGTIVGVGLIGSHGGVRIDCTYVYDGKTYSYAFSGPRKLYSKGQAIELVVDPDQPSRCRQSLDVVSPLRDSTAAHEPGEGAPADSSDPDLRAGDFPQ